MRNIKADSLAKASRNRRNNGSRSLNEISSAIGNAIIILNEQTSLNGEDEFSALLRRLDEAEKLQKEK